MGIFDKLRPSDINKGVEEYRGNVGSLLIDVRTGEEYSQGHIPGSVNIPLDSLKKIEKVVSDKKAPLYVHCLSGVRSGRAVSELRGMGYENVKNIGGISGYKGEIAV